MAAAVAIGMGSAGEDFLVSLLDSGDESIRKAALVVLLLFELRAHDGTPRHSLACLSSRMPRVRLAGAQALQCFGDPDAAVKLGTEIVNDRGQQPPWSIPAETVETLANLIVLAQPQVKARTVTLLRHLDNEKQDAWDLHWAVHTARFADAISQAQKDLKKRKQSKLQYSPEQLEQLAFGAYVGIVREQGTTGGRRSGQGEQVVRVRQTAINRLVALAKAKDVHRAATLPVLVQALGDPNQAVRFQAFDALKEIDMDAASLGSEALQSGHTDLGVAGLKLLTETASSEQEGDVIRQAMLTRTDPLALEAAKLLLETKGSLAVAPAALEASSQQVREQAVGWLAEEYDKQKKAQAELRKALKSAYQHVRRAAAVALAIKKDKAAFDALVELLKSEQKNLQVQAIGALEKLGDQRSPDALLDRLENDPSGTAQVDRLLQVVGGYRRPENVDRLLRLMDHEKWRNQCFMAVRVISGHDQRIEDPEDEKPDKSWEEKQHPRHDEVLAKLQEKCVNLGMPLHLLRVMDAARWARGKEVDPVLATLAANPDDRVRHQAVQAIGWRLRKRGGPAEPLVTALDNRDGHTKFYAAEGLAKAGRAEGISVLLAGVDLMSDLALRGRAVTALGELADERGLDTLLRLANEDRHALQEAAAEAIGHLGASKKAEDIFILLQRLSKGHGGVAENALRGLRWFNTFEGWQLVQDRAKDYGFWQRETAVEMLGYHDEAGTRDLLLDLIANETEGSIVETAMTSARRLWGDEALEPDYAWLSNAAVVHMDYGQRALERICSRGEPKRILEILPKCRGEGAAQQLSVSLLGRSPLPINEAAEALSSNEPRKVQLASHILGRAGKDAAKDHGKSLEAAITHWRSTWDDRRTQMLKENTPDTELFEVTQCLRSLIWAAGRLGVAGASIVDALKAWPDDALYQDVRIEAATALGQGETSKTALDQLESAAAGNNYRLRETATGILAAQDAKRATARADTTLSDRASFNRLASAEASELADTLQNALAGSHYQSVALPHVIAQADVASLDLVMTNPELPESTRLGAIEGLAKIANEEAEAKLAEFGGKEKDEELGKAAWRALRRSKRSRQKQAT
jgi:ParB family chromosome partitioning protein